MNKHRNVARTLGALGTPCPTTLRKSRNSTTLGCLRLVRHNTSLVLSRTYGGFTPLAKATHARRRCLPPSTYARRATRLKRPRRMRRPRSTAMTCRQSRPLQSMAMHRARLPPSEPQTAPSGFASFRLTPSPISLERVRKTFGQTGSAERVLPRVPILRRI